MKMTLYKRFSIFLVAGAMAFLASCNKDVADPTPIVPAAPTGQSLADIVNSDASFTILKAAITRASTSTTSSPSLATLLADRTAEFTVFAPTDAAFALLGVTSAAALNAFTPGRLDTLLRSHIVGTKIFSASFSSPLPNTQLPSQFVLAAPSATLPPGLRMSVFPSKNNGVFWANNVPISQVDVTAANGVIHKVGAVLIPPSQALWDRINTDANLTYLKAAIQRADSGVVAASTLQAALLNPAANLTVFAPNDVAFKQALTAQLTIGLIPVVTLQLIPVITQQLIPVITQQLIAAGATPAQAAAQAPILAAQQAPALAAQQAPAIAAQQAAVLASTPAVFSNPALYSVLTPTTVKGLVVYHLLGTRAFSVNLPLTATKIQTLLNTAIPTHPGVTVKATFGATGVTAATVQGAVNPTASNVLINPLPAPAGTSDQHYINGVLHIIDQVLVPQQ